jgi:alpha-amylase
LAYAEYVLLCPFYSRCRLATERANEYELLGPEVVSTMGNFIDNHDVPRFLTQQPDDVLMRNALAWIMLADGLPTIYYGTGSGMMGNVQHGGNRMCLWEQGYNESNPTFQTISRLAK